MATRTWPHLGCYQRRALRGGNLPGIATGYSLSGIVLADARPGRWRFPVRFGGCLVGRGCGGHTISREAPDGFSGSWRLAFLLRENNGCAGGWRIGLCPFGVRGDDKAVVAGASVSQACLSSALGGQQSSFAAKTVGALAWCGREDSNFHGVAPTSTSSLRVYHSATTARGRRAGIPDD
jgi:hypothetical protein